METRAENGVGHTREEEIERLNAHQRGRSWSLPVDDGDVARVPAVGVKQWRRVVPPLVDSTIGRALCAHHGVGVAVVLVCAPVIARFAEKLTGRGITASVATMAAAAGVSEKQMRRARYVLRDLGLAVEVRTGRHLSGIEIAAARAHHGGRQLSAASVWCLTLPRPEDSAEGSGYLSPTTSVVGSPSVGKSSPTRENRAGRMSKLKERREEPRPIHLQRAAAELVAACQGMDVGVWASTGFREYVRLPGWHIGAIADALVAAGVDTRVWTGRAVARRLTAFTVERGLTWPNRIQNPVGFLRALLVRVDWSTPPPAVRRLAAPLLVRRPKPVAGADSPGRRAAMAAAAEIGRRGAERRREEARAVHLARQELALSLRNRRADG